MSSPKSQVSMELVLIFAFILTVFIVLMGALSTQFSELNQEKDQAALDTLAQVIRNEVFLATQVSNNYIRKFELPSRVNGRQYTLAIEDGDLLTIQNEDSLLSTILLPVIVKGGFIGEIEQGQTEHCITKSQFDGIRISKNQASIEPNLTDSDADGMLDIAAGEKFWVYVRVNCLENVKAVQYILQFDADTLTFLSDQTLYQKDSLGQFVFTTENPFFISEFDGITGRAGTSPQFWDPGQGVLGFIFIAKESSSGSGNLARLQFLAKEAGQAKIAFHPQYEDKNLVLLDKRTGKETKKGLPPSKIGAEIMVQTPGES
ncbi:hypothetical protein HY491_04305 [Candidatus Woesearchaeota archaeon]|nr:hypothetical protein [Candidatus Woesearchaeota archaeon]